MQKKERKEIEQQLSITIAYFLKKQHPVAAKEMAKIIKSSSKEIARKFVKEIAKTEDKKKALKATSKPSEKKIPAKKKVTVKKSKSLKTVRKSAK